MIEAPKTLVLHIGSEKTGSKSIQHSMRRSADHLYRQYGILYPRRPPLFLRNAHYPILSAFLDASELDFVAQDKRLTVGQLRDALVFMRQRSSAETTIFSAEHFSSRLRPPAIAALRDVIVGALPDHRVQVLYHVRSQTTQYCAAMSTRLKTLGVEIQPAFAISSEANRFLNHYRVASDWADVFGQENVIVRNFHAGDAIPLFYDFLGIPAGDRQMHKPARRNTSLSREQAKILMAINSAFGAPNFENEELIKLRRHVQGSLIYYLSSVLSASTPLISMLMTQADLDHFRREFAEPNRQLQHKFGLDFDLNDFMDIELPPAPAADGGESAAYLAELGYWQKQIGQGPLSAGDAAKVARRLRTLLLGKHIRRLLTDRGRALDMSRELVGRI